MTIYVGTSVVVALLTLESKTPAVTSWFAGLNETPCSADWVLTEFSSALSIKRRTGQLNESSERLIRKEFSILTSGGLRLIPVGRAAFRRAAEMLEQSGQCLRAGDSLHLAVAQELQTRQIVTLDLIQAENASRFGIEATLL